MGLDRAFSHQVFPLSFFFFRVFDFKSLFQPRPLRQLVTPLSRHGRFPWPLLRLNLILVVVPALFHDCNFRERERRSGHPLRPGETLSVAIIIFVSPFSDVRVSRR